jgi:CHAD domain-containing protein
MAFQLKSSESLSDGITRNVKSQIEMVLEQVRAKSKPRQRDALHAEAVHEIRKSFKRIRAALRLVRDELGNDVYHDENWNFRDAARPVSEVRDAVVLVEAMDKLAGQLAKAIEPEAFTRLREALLANQREVARRVIDDEKAFTSVEEEAARALARVPDWTIERDGWVAIESGLRRVYRRGHRGLALASAQPTVPNLHEWRKQANYLWHQLQLLEASWTAAQQKLVDQIHALSTLLGDDHDLAVLRETLATDPLSYGGQRVLKDVFAVIDARRAQLERQAFVLGRKLYKDSPESFASRIEGYFTGKPVKPRSRRRLVAR